MMADSDRLLESLYDLADRQQSERTRLEVVRAGLIAAQYRAARIKDARPGATPSQGSGNRRRSATRGDAHTLAGSEGGAD